MRREVGVTMTEILVGTAITVMTAAVMGLFSKVSDLSQADARSAVRLDIHDKAIDGVRADIDRLSVGLEAAKIDVAKTRANCDDWMRKIRQRLDGRP